MYRKRYIWIAFIVSFFICLIGEAIAWSNAPEDYLTYPVLLVLENNQAATGFYIVKNKVIFFVTARHAFLQEDKKNNAFILTSNTALLKSCIFGTTLISNNEIKLDLNKLYSKDCIIYSKSDDVLVVKIANFINEEVFQSVEGVTIKKSEGPFNLISMDNMNDVKKYKEVMIGSEVFVFGYPISIGIRELPQIDFSKPLVRKGIVAGKNEEAKTIILDCFVDFGNSGSPVLEHETIYERNNPTPKYKLIGLVAQFVPFMEETVNIKYNTRNYQINNSGYSVVIPIDTVFELIRGKK